MRAVIQRVNEASVTIEQTRVSEIKKGFLVLLGIHNEDTQEDVDYLVKKIAQLRVFEDEDGKMNLSIDQVKGSILSVSQFTLYANTKKGNRPSFVEAGQPELAIPLYESFNEGLREWGIDVKTGEFGADMQVALVNDGPVTIMMDTKNK